MGLVTTRCRRRTFCGTGTYFSTEVVWGSSHEYIHVESLVYCRHTTLKPNIEERNELNPIDNSMPYYIPVPTRHVVLSNAIHIIPGSSWIQELRQTVSKARAPQNGVQCIRSV